jgi:Domain of unknown function (DUF4340)
MPRTLKWLGELLAVQILMAVGLNLPALWPMTQPIAGPLVEVTKDRINRMILEGPDHTKVVLVKEGDAWTLLESGKFPADSNRVNIILEKVTSSKTGPPIATTAGAKARFKVDDENFERRITFAENDKTLATLYVGSSPGLRRSYVRAGGSDAIFALELAAYDVPVQLADWEDKTVLHLSKNDITALEVAGLRIERAAQPASSSPGKQTDNQLHPAATPPTWEAKGLEAGRHLELKSDAVDKLTQLLADLSFEKVLGRDLRQEYGLEKPLLMITLTRKTGESMTYLLGKNPKSDDYTLKVSTRPEYFRLPSYRATALLEAADRKQLLNTASEPRAPTKS